MDQTKVAALREKLMQASHIMVLSGAGMSTESGIPDFRSTGGLWTEDTARMKAMSRALLFITPSAFLAEIQGIVSDENERRVRAQ